VLNGREWGIFRADLPHLMPFLYKTHYMLYMPGKWGEWLMGIVALVWMFDCFVGFYLTLPAGGSRPARKSWARRWLPAWLIKRNASRARLNYDLHRAGGLWVWVVLFALATSGVFFNLRTELFRPVANTFSPLSEDPAVHLKTLPQSSQALLLSYEGARGSSLSNEHYENVQSGGYAVGRLNIIDPLHLIVGARVTNWTKVGADWQGEPYRYSRNQEITPYAGLIDDFDQNHSVFVSYTDIFNPQNVQDRAGSYLDPVTGEAYEAGTRVNTRMAA
jgi:hypothetical protein